MIPDIDTISHLSWSCGSPRNVTTKFAVLAVHDEELGSKMSNETYVGLIVTCHILLREYVVFLTISDVEFVIANDPWPFPAVSWDSDVSHSCREEEQNHHQQTYDT